MRTLPVLLVALFLAPSALALLAGAAPALANDALRDADARLAGFAGYRDVGYGLDGAPHLAVLWTGDVPADAPRDLHAALATVHYANGAMPGAPDGQLPMTHGALIPAMQLLAQDVPLGIRPGAWVDAPSGCTTSFILRDAQARLYVTTAGHCIAPGQTRFALFRQGEVGGVVAWRNAGVGDDWAIIRIDPARYGEVDATMNGWAGPDGLAGGATPDLLVKHYGFGTSMWMTPETRCRAGALGYWGLRSFNFYGHVLWGDSGSAAQSGDGLALGIVTHLSPGFDGNNAGTRFDFAISEMERVTGLSLDLVTGRPVLDACSRGA